MTHLLTALINWRKQNPCRWPLEALLMTIRKQTLQDTLIEAADRINALEAEVASLERINRTRPLNVTVNIPAQVPDREAIEKMVKKIGEEK